MKICKLSLEEVGRLENYGELPRCVEHTHMSISEAVNGIKLDLLISVGEKYDLSAVTEQWSNDRTWRGRSSQGFQVMQLVRVGK